ncbi:YicC/YloC family endoribonuclease [Enterococcus quebecensis]|uniref:YicC family protein n=1 Tax=Enterococcus quebecensis TaxID=903983 RepID=A0A1E5GU83_9ENTE|nr:YicC/YloC family endoribonuclease [Enterococcus quebecensis]OEG15870.1 YicC family protein [Enterococcus quebecensis]OJG73541.1 TIGR00255 family protein [Enterococcus quebecensis]
MKSMTGFGKETFLNDMYQIDVEIKSVNQRFLDIQLRMPKEVNPHEMAIRQLMKETLQRGRIEAYINIKQTGSGNKEVLVHWDMIHQLLGEVQQELAANYPQAQFDPVQNINQLLNNSDYVEVTEKQEVDDTFGTLVLETVKKAVERIDASRLQEGQKIQQVLTTYGCDFNNLVNELTGFVAIYEKDYREKFETRLNEWLGAQVDETRLLTELAILLEKGDIHEELDRLAIHVDKLQELLLQSEPVGRELDFLMQEMNREVNTVGSKSSSIEIKNIVVQMKTILEKIREQIQNVE